MRVHHTQSVDNMMGGRRPNTLAVSSSTSGTNISSSRHKSMDFGKFYQTSYLDMNGNVIQKGSISSPNLHPAKFHRPDNFSYSKPPPKFGKTKKPGMLDLLRGGSPVKSPRTPEKRTPSLDRAKSPERPAETEAVIKLSHYPSAELRKDVQPAIEREDWPAPPATAVVYKNLLRASLAKRYTEADSDDEDTPIDPKMQKELDEISKIQDSAMVKCIREDIAEQMQHEKKKLLDPRSASRTPSASKEPHQPPRFESPINASPSRNLVERPRFISESAVKSSQISSSNNRPVIHSTVSSHRYKVKPGYSFGYVSKSLSTVPPGTPGAYVYDSFNHDSDDDEDLDVREMERRMHVVDLVTRGIDEEDSDSVFEKSSTSPSHISNFDGSPFLNAISFDYHKRTESVLSLWEDLLFQPVEPLPYDEIKLTSLNRRKGLSVSNLEKYLSNEEFQEHLGTTREEFYKLPEFRRNDLKKKANLFK